MTDFSLPGYPFAVLIEAAFLAVAALLVVPGPGRLVALPAALVLVRGRPRQLALRRAAPRPPRPGPGRRPARPRGPGRAASCCSSRSWGCRARRSPSCSPWRAGRGRPVAAGAGGVALVLVAGDGPARRRWRPQGTPRDGCAWRSCRAAANAACSRSSARTPAQVFDAQLRASRRIERPVDLVLWPEDVVDVDRPVADAPRRRTSCPTWPARLDTTLVAGVVEDADERALPQRGGGVGPGRAHRRPLRQGAPGAVRRVHPVPQPHRPGRGHSAPSPATPSRARAPACSTSPPGRLGRRHLLRGVLRGPGPGRGARRRPRCCSCRPTPSSFDTGQVPAQELAAARLRAARDRPHRAAGRAHRLHRRRRLAGPGARAHLARRRRRAAAHRGAPEPAQTWATQLGPRLGVALADPHPRAGSGWYKTLTALPSDFLAQRR